MKNAEILRRIELLEKTRGQLEDDIQALIDDVAGAEASDDRREKLDECEGELATARDSVSDEVERALADAAAVFNET